MYYDVSNFTENTKIFSHYTSFGLNIYCIRDINARFGDLNIKFNQEYSENVDRVTNHNGHKIASIFNLYNLFPINHLINGDICFPGDFTFKNRNGHSQVDFLFSSNVNNIINFTISSQELAISDHKA